MRHPLIFFVAFAINQHQGSLSFSTSLPAYQQPAILKSRESWRRSWLCLDAHFQNVGIYTRSARHTSQRVSKSVPLSILYLYIFFKYELSTIFTINTVYISVYIQPRYFYLIFRSINVNNMNQVILHSVRPPFWTKLGLFIHLEATVAVKAVTLGCNYLLVRGWRQVSEVASHSTK